MAFCALLAPRVQIAAANLRDGELLGVVDVIDGLAAALAQVRKVAGAGSAEVLLLVLVGAKTQLHMRQLLCGPGPRRAW